MSDLWGGRFEGPMADLMRRFSSSLPVDYRLARYDVIGSKAHAKGLKQAGVLSDEQHQDLESAFEKIEAEIAEGAFPGIGADDPLPEDIHTAIEDRLVELTGELGYRIHAGRSRNDQVVTATLLWLKEAGAELEDAVLELARTLLSQAERHPDTVIPAYTHLQRAQPVLLAHHLMAHVTALERDAERVGDALRRADRCPSGAAASTGTSIPLDRDAIASELGFARVAENSMDAVADRDWALETVSACTTIMTHLSRLSEELVIWSSDEFGLVKLAEGWCTGSSAMPHKKNPDVAELVRGRAARVLGALVSLHGTLKGLPLTYNRDLQEDKAPLFDALDCTTDCLAALTEALAGAEFFGAHPIEPDFTAAMDLAEELVVRGKPFREAHGMVGELVKRLEQDGRGLPQVTGAELEALGASDLNPDRLTWRGCLEAKKTSGSTHPAQVTAELRAARERLKA